MLVAVVVERALGPRRGVLVEVRTERGVELGRPAVRDQRGEVLAVRDHDDVAAGVLTRPQLREDLTEERRVVVDLVVVGDRDPGLVRELVERGIAPVRLVDVEGPVGEVDVIARRRGVEVHRPARLGSAAGSTRAARARREDRGEAQGADGDAAELDHVPARQPARGQPTRKGRVEARQAAPWFIGHSSSSSIERSSCGVTAKVYSGFQVSVTVSPCRGASSAPRFWT